MIDFDDVDILLGVFKSWRDDNPKQTWPEHTVIKWTPTLRKIGESIADFEQRKSNEKLCECKRSGEYELFQGQSDYQVTFDAIFNDGKRDLKKIDIILGSSNLEPIRLSLSELGKFEHLESVSISVNDRIWDDVSFNNLTWNDYDTVGCPLELIGQIPFEKLPLLKALTLEFLTLSTRLDRYTSHKLKINTCPLNGLRADKLRGIGKLSSLERLEITGVKGVDSDIISEIQSLKSLKTLSLINCDGNSEAWAKCILKEESIPAILQVTSPFPRDIQEKILKDLKQHIPLPIQRKVKDDFSFYHGAAELDLKPLGWFENYPGMFFQARKVFPELEEFESRYYLEETCIIVGGEYIYDSEGNEVDYDVYSEDEEDPTEWRELWYI